MSDLIRILYISRATFAVAEDAVPARLSEPCAQAQLVPEIEQILAQSRRHNRRAGIVGMLYFADGHFFQCIEGERSGVESLYRKISRDPRHRDLKLLASHRISRLSFPNWSMKYVPVDGHARDLLDQHGFGHFDPYRFDHHLIERMLQLMQGVADPTADIVEGRPSAPARQSEVTGAGPTSAHSPLSRALVAALAMSGAALILSLATLTHVLMGS